MKKKWLSVLVITAVLGTTTACSSGEEQPVTAVKVEKKVVEALSIKQEQVVRLSELSGTLEPMEETTVSFEVGGRVVELKREEGDQIKAGDLLARIDASDYSLQLDRANASVSQAGASLQQVNNGAQKQEIATSKANVDKAKIALQQAQDNFNRIKKLYEENAVSQNDFEQAENRLKLAEKDVLSAEQAYSLTAQGARFEVRDQTRSAYNLAVISKEQAALTLQKTQLKSPIGGTVISKLTSAGQLINVGTPVYRIGQVDTLKVVLPVPDRDISAWKTGDKVTVGLYDQTREGTVAKIYPSTNQSTGTIGVEVNVPNAKRDWYAGQVVKASRSIKGKNGIFLPIESVISSGMDKPYVFVISGDKAVKTEVTVGELIDNKLEITSGLSIGNQVIVKGMERLFDGDTVEAAGGSKQ